MGILAVLEREPKRRHQGESPKENEGYRSAMAWIVSNRIPVAQGHEREFEQRWKNRKWAIAESQGFIRTEVLRPIKGDYYIVMTHWQSKQDFERWTESPAFKESHMNPPPKETFSGPSQLEIHETIAEHDIQSKARTSTTV